MSFQSYTNPGAIYSQVVDFYNSTKLNTFIQVVLHFATQNITIEVPVYRIKPNPLPPPNPATQSEKEYIQQVLENENNVILEMFTNVIAIAKLYKNNLIQVTTMGINTPSFIIDRASASNLVLAFNAQDLVLNALKRLNNNNIEIEI